MIFIAVFEEKTLIQSGDSLGNEVIHYPITKVECISDLDDYLATQDFGISDMADAEGILSIQNGGTGNSLGRAVSANTLTTARTVRTNLASTSTASFNGSANITPGVSGVLPTSNGGTGNSNGSVATLTTARTVQTNLASSSSASFNGSANITPGVTGVLPLSNGGTGNSNGSVATLTTARTVQTNLASTSTASFNGSANISPGVTGVLPLSNGGTGGTNATTALASLSNLTSLALGRNPSASGSNSIAIGSSTNSSNTSSIALGNSSSSTGLYSIAVGLNSNSTTSNTISIGANSIASGVAAVAIGSNSTSGSTGTLAIGTNSYAPSLAGIAIGASARAAQSNCIAFGVNSYVSGAYSAAFGYNSYVFDSYYSFALGYDATVINGTNSAALGYMATIYGSDSIQLGNATHLSILSCRVNLTSTSDQRDKIDIADTTKSLEFLNKIRTVTYKFNHRDLYHSNVDVDTKNSTTDENGELVPAVLSADDERKLKIKEKRHKFGIYDYDKVEHAKGSKKGSRGRVGVLAQQVQQAMIEVYGDDNYADLITDSMYDVDSCEIEEGMENTLAVNSSGFIPFLIDGIKQLSSTVTDLQKRIEILEGD